MLLFEYRVFFLLLASKGNHPLVLRHRARCPITAYDLLNPQLHQRRAFNIWKADTSVLCPVMPPPDHSARQHFPPRVFLKATFMISNPSISVLGSSVAIFRGECVRKYRPRHQHEPASQAFDEATRIHLPASQVQRIVRHPTDRAFISWSLLFGCCIAHPSVMLRRDRVINAGGYDPGTEPAEDYDLWLRMDGSVPGCLANTGEVKLSLHAISFCSLFRADYVVRVGILRYNCTVVQQFVFSRLVLLKFTACREIWCSSLILKLCAISPRRQMAP